MDLPFHNKGEVLVGMLCYIITTGKCNLKCKYCGGSFPSSLVPPKIGYTIDELRDFLHGDDELTIAFYGGEPLLNAALIAEIMDEVRAQHYVIQTNGFLIDALPSQYWLRMDTVLLSIDGVERLTDYYRGSGTYKKVVSAASKLRALGYKGDLVARMTATMQSDIDRDVKHLLGLQLFDHVHWQLDAVWSPNELGFRNWLVNTYLPKLSRLVDFWVSKVLDGKILGIAPFKALTHAIVRGSPLGKPPCGAGWNALTVNTNGDVLACPIAVDVEWARMGNIKTSSREELLEKARAQLGIGEPCERCRYISLCGGRCLYAHYERLWGEDGFKLLCLSAKTLIDALQSAKPLFEEAVEDGRIAIEDLEYPKFANTVEIIP
ncbi:MAG: TIGR04084 family radical SAM/SPASM domain-containing protein [Candidatus Nezhaarchaeota archaeon]|nr:TIGR04084 family radical SAM/SPASM domain-containing protein [Candidatus Nezhaarchaeota archaeon]